MGKHTKKSEFTLSGRFLTYILSKGCSVKGIRLATSQGEQDIKLAKSLRPACSGILQPGAWIQVQGCQKINIKTGKIKLKAKTIMPALPNSSPSSSQQPSELVGNVQKGKIRICQKSSCRKRGSQQVLTALNSALQASGQDKEIQLQPMGCIGKCKAGPNLVVLPDKARYTKVKPKNITNILQQHF
ncbi:(2Fe-2S) ferredoxin domain-containing protein [Acaryochloris sp. 'Moss Beach']|uniref:(2Fe-2S) ferredoxin domain-containing protein n=1 Tax=Acaryochloris TaxID=155977 RepID=UPI001BB0D199|nr:MULTISPECIES: (2Fe-2S) ferredoxin domain-containing protein [Acaryochloris]QUY41622.1 (2Fe-2S) ferredoxin domain-containing protein [Acaryochloris marina S15]UJB70782.1 (2Fe-2S) ferredoxin domain-containing protein [Acaryochloris sp. 'Moss Beach']